MLLASSRPMRHEQTAVLVVEDDFLIRMNAVDIFERAGLTVYEASNADEAIRVLESREDIRLVFTDINMPGSMDGLGLAHRVSEAWPSIALIVTSGRINLRTASLPPQGVFIAKPYRADQILREMRQMVGDEALLH
jgi:two-component system, response regulator PdtaR